MRGGDELGTEALLQRLTLSVKGERVSARVTLLAEHATLPSLMPLLRAYPKVQWQAAAHSSIGGDSIVLHDSAAPPAGAPSPPAAVPLVSLFVPFGGGTAELEVLAGPAGLTSKEAAMLAQILVAIDRETSSRPRSTGDGLLRPGDLFGPLGGFGFGRGDGGGSGHGGTGRGDRGGRGGDGAGGSPVERLEALGVRVILPEGGEGGARGSKAAVDGADGGEGANAAPRGQPALADESWASLAGSEAVRVALEESLVLPLLHPEVYQEVMAGTRRQAVAPHTKSILFEGPPVCAPVQPQGASLPH